MGGGAHIRASIIDTVTDALMDEFPSVTVLTVPLPPRGLSPNFGRNNFNLKAKHKSEHKAAVKIALQEHVGLVFGEAILHARWVMVPDSFDRMMFPDADWSRKGWKYRMPYKPSDEDNARASMKWIQDSLVELGFFDGDTKRSLHSGMVELVRHNDKKAIAKGVTASHIELIIQSRDVKRKQGPSKRARRSD